MKFQTLALTTVIGLTAVTVGMAQDAATRSLLLRGTNTVTANVGTLTVPALTLPRTYTLQNQSGTVTLQTPAVLGTNTVILADATGKLINAAAMTDGQLLVGSTGAAPVPATPTGTRGLAITLGAGSIDFALPTGSANATLRFSGGNWVETGANFTIDGSGNTVNAGTLNVNAATTLGNGDAGDLLTINTGGGADLSISEGAITRAGNIDINPGTGNRVQTNGNLELGTNAAAGGSLFWNDNTGGASFNGEMEGPLLYTAARTYTLPDASGTILLSTGGTANQMTRFGAGGLTIVDASLSDNGTGTLARAGNVALNTGAGNTLSTDANFRVDGSTTLGNDNADLTRIRGDIDLNVTNTAANTVNINTSANANTTNIGNGSTVANVTNIFANSLGAGVIIVNGNPVAGTGLAIPTAVTNGLTIGTGGGSNPVTGIQVNAASTGITVNTGGGNDLTINQDALTRNGDIAINPGAANTVTTNGNLQVDGNTTLGNANTDLVTINGTVRGSESRAYAAVATNTFAGSILIDEAVDGGAGPWVINNSQVGANSTIILTVYRVTNIAAATYTVNVTAVTAGVSFAVTPGGALDVAEQIRLNYMIINP